MKCDGCDRKMELIRLEDLNDESGAEEELYRCPKCGNIKGQIEY
ncbi:hypothetical protein LCGC14_1649220 [marine sediment metagenome]|uniref:TFIIS-type domain-containing protein n=1 Tax=marine sediment metagenome TaxID=412755 RepID=A0A0F9KD87_9ZZZZ